MLLFSSSHYFLVEPFITLYFGDSNFLSLDKILRYENSFAVLFCGVLFIRPLSLELAKA